MRKHLAVIVGRIRSIAAHLGGFFELRDYVFFAGLAIAAWGGASLSVPWTRIAVGVVLVLKAHGAVLPTKGAE